MSGERIRQQNVTAAQWSAEGGASGAALTQRDLDALAKLAGESLAPSLVLPARYYSATFIAEHRANLAVSFLTIPRPPQSQHGLGAVAEILKIELRAEVSDVHSGATITAAQLPAALGSVLDSPGTSGDESCDTSFLEQITFAPIIPFESSPMRGQALASLLVQGAGGSMGAALGVLAAGAQPTPLLLLSVPLGVIIGGGALGISRGLASGLEQRIHLWVTGNSHAPESGATPDSITSEPTT